MKSDLTRFVNYLFLSKTDCVHRKGSIILISIVLIVLVLFPILDKIVYTHDNCFYKTLAIIILINVLVLPDPGHQEH